MKLQIKRAKQHGLALLDVLFAMALLGLIIAGASKWMAIQKEKNAAGDYRARIELVIETLQKYQYQQHSMEPPVPLYEEFPNLLNDLVTPDEQFWINCTPADEAARSCVRPDSAPWTVERLGYEAGQRTVTINGQSRDIAYAKLTFPLSSTAIAPIYRAKWATELLKIPYAKAQTNGDITVMVYDPLLSQLYDAFLQHDGSVPLSDDWDVGGQFAVTNAKDLTILNADGTQKIVSKGLVNVVTVKHGERVYKPACPQGTTPDIMLSIGNIYIASDLELTGSQKPYLITTTNDYWDVGLEVRVKSLITGNIGKSHSGEITAFTQCK
ncbi:type II secretion system protein [Vibrio splendidus]|uniref:prepilin-type cleavage/methylation domain-containing protein n=1 Tax=Vibrio splendidus TaxID=29497 RepID=UPI000C8588B2|nr:prepilin-type cleavage/methylation domain-containing protein [Vibrio splendidus]PMO15596.1 prepilin-type N-terminal cleavage/methylation domain-containing protein [Vibrio splendidus]